jgi:hypothetical protein
MFWNFYLVKYRKIANDAATTEARDKISTDILSLGIKKLFTVK